MKTLQFTDDVNIYMWDIIPGPPGLSGEPGSSGNPGSVGATGIQGIPGTRGDTGATGFQGPTGATGHTGKRNTSPSHYVNHQNVNLAMITILFHVIKLGCFIMIVIIVDFSESSIITQSESTIIMQGYFT